MLLHNLTTNDSFQYKYDVWWLLIFLHVKNTFWGLIYFKCTLYVI